MLTCVSPGQYGGDTLLRRVGRAKEEVRMRLISRRQVSSLAFETPHESERTQRSFTTRVRSMSHTSIRSSSSASVATSMTRPTKVHKAL